MYQLIEWFQVKYPELHNDLLQCNHNFDEENLNPYHLESDCWSHTMMVCKIAELSYYGKVVQIAALLHDIGKPVSRRINPKNNHVQFFGHEELSAKMAVNILDHMMSENIEEIKMFDGIENMFHELKKIGHKIAIVSTNSKENIIKVLGEDLIKINDHFVGGVSLFGKESKLKKVLRLSGIDKKDAIYIGDEMRDVLASKKVGMPCGAVAWGVNDADALAELEPDEMFYEVEQILQRV